MKKVYIHIGTEKTGTTSIQNVLAKNRESLLKNDYCYPSSPGVKNHEFLAIYCAPESTRDLRSKHGLMSDVSLSQFFSMFSKNLKNEFISSGANNIIFSNEHLSSRVHTVDLSLIHI